MRLEFATSAQAQAAADRIHESMIVKYPDYAASVAAGQTTAWAKPYSEGGKWYINCKPRCLPVLTTAERAALKVYRP